MRVQAVFKNSGICSLCDLWLDQEISDLQRVVFESHLKECEKCRRKLQQWQNLEQEVVAAFRLFGESSSLTDLAEEASLAPIQLEAGSLALTGGQRMTEQDQPDAQRSFRHFRAWVIASVLLLSAAISWVVCVKPDHRHQHAESIQIKLPSDLASSQADSTTPSHNPLVRVHVQLPVIATTPVTTPRFTVVNVYPVFLPDPTDQVN